jgi:hypothetical protein
LDGVLPRKELVTIDTFALTAQTTGQVGSKNIGAPQTLTPCVAMVLRADDGNAATIYWGMGGSPNDPLAKGETVAVDLPPGYFLDLSQLCIQGTKADLIHVVACIIQAKPANEA